MKELIAKLMAEAGLTESQAVKSIEAMSAHIKSKLPPMMHPMIDGFLSIEQSGGDDILG
jgi:nucleoid DNA-binding protein